MSNVTKNLLLLWKKIIKKRFTHKTRCTKCSEVQTASLREGDDILKDMKFDLTFAFYWGMYNAWLYTIITALSPN